MKPILKFTQNQVQTAISDLYNSGFVSASKFTGQHVAGKPHDLPVFNMYEQMMTSYSAMLENNAEMFRMMGSSGVISTRQYTAAVPFNNKERIFGTNYSALSIHNHPNYRGMAGMGEFSACINGYYIRTRHNDYRIFAPVQGTYLQRKEILPPEIPANVLALPLGSGYGSATPFEAGTQYSYMKNIYKDNKEDCVFFLSYMEAWWETYEESNNGDYTDSFRHFNNVSSTKEMLEKSMYFNTSGHKDRLENNPFEPVMVRKVNEFGVPVVCTFRCRINSIPVATLSPTGPTSKEFKLGDGTTQLFPLISLPFDNTKATNGVIDSTNVFKMRRDLRAKFRGGSTSTTWAQIMATSRPIFDLDGNKLQQICQMCPGMMGIDSFLTEEYTQYGLSDVLTKYKTSLAIDPVTLELNRPLSPPENVLNAAYYNQAYTFVAKDASNRNDAIRGFNDPNLMVARNTLPRVIGGTSYMIPLELVLRTPRESFDPLAASGATRPIISPTANGKLSTTPLTNAHFDNYNFTIPADLYGIVSQDGTDVADTSSSAWVTTPSGPKFLRASGLSVFDYNDNGVANTGHRKRFPIFQEYHDYAKAGGDVSLMKVALKTLLKKARTGTLTDADIDDLL